MNSRKRRKAQREWAEAMKKREGHPLIVTKEQWDVLVKYMEDYTQKLGHAIEQRLTFGTSYKSNDNEP